MKKALPRILTIVVIIIITSTILLCINAFTGNPISAAIATSQIRSYTEANYPQLDLQITKASYDFLNSQYYSHASSRISEDTNFRITWDHGKVRDDYEYEVANHFTTFRRLSTEYNDALQKIVADEFPYKTSIVIADIGKTDKDLENLISDMTLDITNPPSETSLTVYTDSDDLSYEELAKRLLLLQSIMNAHEIPISYYSLVLENYGSTGEKAEERFHLFDFPASELSSNNLIDAIKLHQKTWEAEHAK